MPQLSGAVFQRVDEDHNGELDFDEFKRMLHVDGEEDEGELRHLFELLDEDGSGSVAMVVSVRRGRLWVCHG